MGRSRTLLLAVAFACAVAGLAGNARAQVLVAPTRLVFEGRERSAELFLVNKGEKTERYRISLVNRRMNEEGALEEAREPREGERFANGLVRFSPRQVELRPGEPQTVRILVRKPGDLERGEYRSHILFQQIPDLPPPAAPDPNDKGFSVMLRPIFGVSVPVIVRHGHLLARGELSGFELEPGRGGGAPTLRFVITREGERSLYGDVLAHWTPPGGESQLLGRANGVAVYTPNASRPFALRLDLPGGALPRDGLLRLEYREPERAGSTLLAEASLVLAAP